MADKKISALTKLAAGEAADEDLLAIVDDPEGTPETKGIALSSLFSGALVKLTSGQTISDNSAAFISWDAEEYDVGGWWAAGNPTRLTVPAGVSRVILSANVDWEVSSGGERSLNFEKNGAGPFPGSARDFRNATGSSFHGIHSAPIEVTEGDYFEVEVAVSGAGSAQDVDATDFTWFAIRAVR